MAFAEPKNGYNYVNNYQKENYDRIVLVRKKGDREKIKEYCKTKGISMNEFINDSIDRRLKQLKIEL